MYHHETFNIDCAEPDHWEGWGVGAGVLMWSKCGTEKMVSDNDTSYSIQENCNVQNVQQRWCSRFTFFSLFFFFFFFFFYLLSICVYFFASVFTLIWLARSQGKKSGAHQGSVGHSAQCLEKQCLPMWSLPAWRQKWLLLLQDTSDMWSRLSGEHKYLGTTEVNNSSSKRQTIRIKCQQFSLSFDCCTLWPWMGSRSHSLTQTC